ncbi:MAG: phosphoribosyltransferase domain-containing protein [Candidatus Sericytochromatia bacterium]
MEIKLKTGILKLKENQDLFNLTGFSSRINKKRGFLFISKVLGKHIPCKPSIMEKNYIELAKKLSHISNIKNKPTIVIGFAETATALGNGVFEKLALEKAFYIHTTRYKTNSKFLADFKEEHSHAPSQYLYCPNSVELQEIMNSAENIILVDDEFTTGKTINNIVEKLKITLPNVKNYYFVSILNWIKNLNTDNYFSLYKDEFDFESFDIEVDNSIISEMQEEKNLTAIIPYNFGRFGIKNLNYDFENFMLKNNINLTELQDKKILILGTAEFMYLPYVFALFLEKKGVNVYYQSTTRSPINIDIDILSKITFKDNYYENIDNFVYNVIDKSYDKVFVCYETTSIPLEHSLLKQLRDFFEVKELFFME